MYVKHLTEPLHFMFSLPGTHFLGFVPSHSGFNPSKVENDWEE